MAVSSSKKTNALVPYTGKIGTDLVNEKIDEKILRLLGLEDIFDIDYDTYASLLRERIAAARMVKAKIPTEETELLTDEFKRIKGKKGRFKVKKKKISAQNFKKGSATGVKLDPKKLIGGVKPMAALPPAAEANPLEDITSILSEIVDNLSLQNDILKKKAEQDRKNKESDARAGLEAGLEKKFSLAQKIAEKMLAPVKNLLQKIIDFFVILLMGRMVYKLIGWFGDKKNQDKVGSIIKFLSDWWPALIGAFLIFGTGLGGFVSTITGVLIRGIAALASRNPVALGTIIGGGLLGGAATLADKKKDDAAKVTPQPETKPEDQKKEQQQPVQKFASGGLAKLLGGLKEGLSQNKSLASAIGAAAGSALGPLGAILGAVAGSKGGDLVGQIQGFVSGEKGVDKIPAMLSDGEFVMSRGAVQKYGVDTLEAMNAAGGGTNRPKVAKGVPHAYGGGYISQKPVEKEKGFYDKKSKDPAQEQLKTSSSGGDYRKSYFEERLKKIEKQVQMQRALSSGKGVNIKGSTLGTQIGKGFGATYQNRQSIVVPGAAKTGWEPEITIGGMRYFGQVKGNDVIYSSNYAKGLSGQVDKFGARNKSFKGKGGGIVSNLSDKDKKNLPKTKIMMGPDGPFVGYLRYKNGEPEYARPVQRKKGMLESLGDFFDPKGAKKKEENLNARTMRLTGITDLEDMRRRGMQEENIKKMLNERLGPNGYARAVNDLKAKDERVKKDKQMKSQAGMGQYSAANIMKAQNAGKVSNLGADYKKQELKLAAAANKPRVSPPSPPPKPKVIVRSKTNTIGTGGGGINKRDGSKVPQFGAVCKANDRPRNAKILGIF